MTTARLTPRQRQVVVLVAEGRNCRQIAEVMAVRLATVRAHVQQIAKLVPSELPAMRRIRKHATELLRVA